MTRLFDLIPMTNRIMPTRGLFDGFFEDWNTPLVFEEGKSVNPAFDITERENEYLVTAEIPGIDIKDLDVTLSEGILTVKGEKKQEKEDKGENYHRVERVFGSFHRTFRLPGEVQTDKVDAKYKDGVLTLTLPKSEEKKPKKIEVK